MARAARAACPGVELPSAGAPGFGASSVPSQATRGGAELRPARGYSACEIEFGQVERGAPKRRIAIGILDDAAGIAAACGSQADDAAIRDAARARASA
jgi:hypothetical protein